MLTISKPLSSGQAQSYHKLEFTAATQSYYKQGGVIEGHWQGRLMETFGLAGSVSCRGICAAFRRQTPGNRGADRPAAGGARIHQCGRKDDQCRRASRRLGCDFLRSQVRFAHRPGRR